MPRKSAPRRRRAGPKRKSGVRKARGGKLSANKMDKATVIEVQQLAATTEGGNYVGHSLSQYARALAVSTNYRYYRCKKVELEFIPYANVFPGGTAFPELYFQVDRTQGSTAPGAALPLPTKNMMLARGVMPQKWTGIIKKSYNPSVCRLENLYQDVLGANVQNVVGVTTTPVLNKWYQTQNQNTQPGASTGSFPVGGGYGPSLLRYFGAAYFINQELAPPAAILGTIKMRVHWEFKEPLWLNDTQVDVSGSEIHV